MNSIKQLDITDIMSKEDLQTIVLQLATTFENAWSQYSKLKYITKHFKEWWNQEYTNSLNRYCE